MKKEQFVKTLSSTGRKGIEQVVAKLGELGFFEAPASSRFHLSCKGGLLEHSLNVYEAAMMLREQAVKARPELEEQLPVDSVAICTLLHDVCKTDIYKEGMLSRKNADGYGRSISATRWTTMPVSPSATARNPSFCSFPGASSSSRRR